MITSTNTEHDFVLLKFEDSVEDLLESNSEYLAIKAISNLCNIGRDAFCDICLTKYTDNYIGLLKCKLEFWRLKFSIDDTGTDSLVSANEIYLMSVNMLIGWINSIHSMQTVQQTEKTFSK